jgi:hypothetical protein
MSVAASVQEQLQHLADQATSQVPSEHPQGPFAEAAFQLLDQLQDLAMRQPHAEATVLRAEQTSDSCRYRLALLQRIPDALDSGYIAYTASKAVGDLETAVYLLSWSTAPAA